MADNPNPNCTEKGGKGEPPETAQDIQNVQTPKQSEKSEQTEKPSEAPFSPYHPEIQTIKVICNHPAHETSKEGVKWTDVAIVILTLGIVVAAILQTRIFKNQWAEMHSAGSQTDKILIAAQAIQAALEKSNANNLEALKKTLNQSEKAMNASNKQSQKVLNSNIESAHLEQRAWVGAIEFQVPKNLEAGKKASFGAVITNTGKTPALNLSEKIIAWPFLKDARFAPVYLPMTTRPSVTVLQPGMRVTIWTSPQLTANLPMGISRLKNGIEVIYVYGELSYEDIFRKTHHTHFCGWLDTDLTSFNSCDTYNDAD